MKIKLSNLVFVIFLFSSSMFAQEDTGKNDFDVKYSKHIDSLKRQNFATYQIGSGEISFVDNFFQVNSLNNFGNYNFNHLKFDGINLNFLYDKSFDYTLISYDENLNFYGNDFLNIFNKIENKNLQLQFVGGSIFGNANVFAQANINDLQIRTRNNYYVSNGFNNPKGSLFNPLSDITKQSFQSTLNLSLSDSKSSIEYNQLILSNFSKNNYNESENEFKDLSNFNSIFTLKYKSQNSEFVSTNGMIFLKYAKRLVNLSDKNQYYKDNELCFGVSLGADFSLINEPTKLTFKYSQNNLDLTLFDKYHEFQAEDLIINFNQKLSLYENNLINFGGSINILNPIDILDKIQYDKIVNYGFNFDFYHFNKTFGLFNELYVKVNYENEMPAFKYLFATNMNDESPISDFNFQNRITFGNKTTTDFLNMSADFNISYVRFNEYFNADSMLLATKLNESWIMNIDFSFSYWIFILDANYLLNLLDKNFILVDRINTLPSMFVRMNLKTEISDNTLLIISINNYEFKHSESIEIESNIFPASSTQFNIKLSQNISDSINLFLAINNVLDEQIPLFPIYYSSGFNYLGGLQITF